MVLVKFGGPKVLANFHVEATALIDILLTCQVPLPTPLAVLTHLIFSINFLHHQFWFSLYYEVHSVFVDTLSLSHDVAL